MVISLPQSLSLAQYVRNQLETRSLKLGLYKKFTIKNDNITILILFRHYAFTHQKIFELTDLTPDNIIPPGMVKKSRGGHPGPRTPKKTPKTPEKILEQEEEGRGEEREERDPSECVSSTNGENMSSVGGEEPSGEVSEDNKGEEEVEEEQQEEASICDNS